MHGQQVARLEIALVGGDGLFQHRHRRGILEQGGEAQPRAGADAAVIGGQVGRQRIEKLLGLGRRAGPEQGQGQVELEFVLVGRILHGVAQAHHFGVRVQRCQFGRLGRGGRERFDPVLLQELA